MKKKKKSSKKKAVLDMEAFEKELNESKKDSAEGAKPKKGADEEEEDEDVPVDTSHLDNVDEAELGDNPFSRPDAPVGVDAGTEAWVSSDREYTYPEVCSPVSFSYSSFQTCSLTTSSSHGSMPLYTQQTQPSFLPPQNDTQLLLLRSTKKETKKPFLLMSLIFAKRCIAKFILHFISSYLH